MAKMDAETSQLDAEAHHIVPEEAWYGAELQKRAPKGATIPEDFWNTGAFTMQEPNLESEPRLQGKAAQVLTHPTNSSKLDAYLANESKQRETAAAKAIQLIRNGLVTHNTLTPILALPDVIAKEQKRRRTVAQRLVQNYEYESSGDEAEDLLMGRQSAPKVKFTQLKHALGRLEQPPAAPKVAAPATRGTRKSLKRKATEATSDSEEQQPSKRFKLNDDRSSKAQLQSTLAVDPEADDADSFQQRSLEFQRVMRDPSHPDCGVSFSEALELAMAKERKAGTLAATHDHWVTEEDYAEAPEEEAAEAGVENVEESTAEHNAETALEDVVDAAPDTQSKPIATQTSPRPLRRAGRQVTTQTDLLDHPSSPRNSPSKAKQTKKAEQAIESTAPAIPVETPSQHQPAAATLPTPSSPPQPATVALPSAAAPSTLRITRITVHPKYDRISFRTATIVWEGGRSFESTSLVEQFSRQMQARDPNRPYRNQQSLLAVSHMTAEEYYGVHNTRLVKDSHSWARRIVGKLQICAMGHGTARSCF